MWTHEPIHSTSHQLHSPALQLPAIIKTEINSLLNVVVVPCDKVLNNKALLDSFLMSTTHYITAFDKQPFHTTSAVLTNGFTVWCIEILILTGAAHR